MPFATLMEINGIDMGDYSARGLTMTLNYINQASQLFRTINGELLDLSEEQMRKYALSITCRDVESPILVGVHPGSVVTVKCVPHLGLANAEDSTPLELTCRVGQWQVARDEYGGWTSYTIPLQEI